VEVTKHGRDLRTIFGEDVELVRQDLSDLAQFGYKPEPRRCPPLRSPTSGEVNKQEPIGCGAPCPSPDLCSDGSERHHRRIRVTRARPDRARFKSVLLKRTRAHHVEPMLHKMRDQSIRRVLIEIEVGTIPAF
jgi:hypothetical protein